MEDETPPVVSDGTDAPDPFKMRPTVAGMTPPLNTLASAAVTGLMVTKNVVMDFREVIQAAYLTPARAAEAVPKQHPMYAAACRCGVAKFTFRGSGMMDIVGHDAPVIWGAYLMYAKAENERRAADNRHDMDYDRLPACTQHQPPPSMMGINAPERPPISESAQQQYPGGPVPIRPGTRDHKAGISSDPFG